MMRTFLLLGVTLLIACSKGKRGEDLKPSPNWHESMQQMSMTMSNLIPGLTRPEVFVSSNEKAELIQRARDLSRLVHAVDEAAHPPSSDPVMKAVSGDLKVHVDESIAKMERGSWSRGARNILDTSRYCIACHTLSRGPAYPGLQIHLEGLSPLRRANYYAATRQFDQAIITYESLLTDHKWAARNEDDWGDGFQKLLAITVRVRQSPSLTMELISRFFDTKSYPKKLSQVAGIWRQHTKEWRAEKSFDGQSLSKIEALIERAEKLESGEAGSGFVLFLRSSALLHEYLKSPDHSTNQQALFLAGRAAEGLKEQNFWTFPEHYYRACVNVRSNTAVALNCSAHLAKLEN